MQQKDIYKVLVDSDIAGFRKAEAGEHVSFSKAQVDRLQLLEKGILELTKGAIAYPLKEIVTEALGGQASDFSSTEEGH